MEYIEWHPFGLGVNAADCSLEEQPRFVLSSTPSPPRIAPACRERRAIKGGDLAAFREALNLRRCLLSADGFYEWQRAGKAKQPYYFEVNDGELFAFAGLWDRWKDARGQWIKSCCRARADVSADHSRDEHGQCLRPSNLARNNEQHHGDAVHRCA